MPLPKQTIGWHEWCALPDLGLHAVQVKIDTGAKSSALHAYNIKTFEKDGIQYASFDINPLRQRKNFVLHCTAPIVERRTVTSSNGEKEKRYVIQTTISMGEKSFPAEITLTSRHKMTYRMLLGRDAIKKGRFIVDSSHSCALKKIKDPETLYPTYNE